MKVRIVLALAALVLAAGALAACEAAPEQTTLCEPGEQIFCRCRGGAAGTKACRADGEGFEACDDGGGPCLEAAGPSEDEDALDEATGKDLLEPCEQSGECKSDLCRMGYCTKPCGNYQECTDEDAGIYGDCITIDGAAQHCVPYCGAQQDCEPFGGPSACGYALATDVVPVTVCADWSHEAPLPPEGTPCVDDWDCHLGHTGRMRVCEFDVCIGGCHEALDCAEGQSCSPGMPGACQP